MVDQRDVPMADPTALPVEPSHGGCGSCGSGESDERCGNGLEKIYPTTAVRFGFMRYIGEFSRAPEMRFTCGAKVIVQTRRGIEMGDQVSLSCSGCDKSVTRDQIRAWVETSGEDCYIFDAGRILREATASDLAEYAHIQGSCRERRKMAQQVAERHKLPLSVIECESPFGGERIIFYFSAAERVDFRGMVKDLAQEYRTRIEMRQIGARDEARLLADYETCGREVCCKVFLKKLKPISMRMAKLQKATLDPSQVSGRCGRLKCCLRYEHASYEELDKQLPRVGKQIRTAHGDGVVTSRQVLTQLVQIRLEDDKLIAVAAEDILLEGEERRAPVSEEGADAPTPSGREGERREGAPRETPRSRPPGTRRRRPKPNAAEPAAPGPSDTPAGQAGPGEGDSDRVRRRRRGKRRRRRPDARGGGSEGNAPPPGNG